MKTGFSYFIYRSSYHVGTGIRVKTYYKIYHLAPFSYFLMGKRFADFMNKIEKKMCQTIELCTFKKK